MSMKGGQTSISRNAIVEHVIERLDGRNAHLDFDEITKRIPTDLVGIRPAGAAHSIWEIVEHLRIAQWDILEFSRNSSHQSPAWPEGYWPKQVDPPDVEAWHRSLTAFRSDLEAMRELVRNPTNDLLLPFPHGDRQTLLREALLVADHNSYHLGELVLTCRLLGLQPAAR